MVIQTVLTQEYKEAVRFGRQVSRLETSLALASRCGDAGWRRLDLPSAPLVDWDQAATGERSTRARPDPTGMVDIRQAGLTSEAFAYALMER